MNEIEKFMTRAATEVQRLCNSAGSGQRYVVGQCSTHGAIERRDGGSECPRCEAILAPERILNNTTGGHSVYQCMPDGVYLDGQGSETALKVADDTLDQYAARIAMLEAENVRLCDEYNGFLIESARIRDEHHVRITELETERNNLRDHLMALKRNWPQAPSPTVPVSPMANALRSPHQRIGLQTGDAE